MTTKILGPEVGYVDLLDNHLLEQQEIENSKPPKFNPLRPSAAGKCARALAYEFNEFRGKEKYRPDEKNPNVIRLLRLGHAVEYHILQMLGEVEFFEVKYRQQVLTFFPISDTERVEGSIDFVIYSPLHRAVGDVKSKGDGFKTPRRSKWDDELSKLRKMKTVTRITENAFWVEDLPAFLEELDDPFFADNFYQLNLYACNPFLQERGIDHAFILRYNKNDSRLMEVRFKPCPELADYVKNKFQTVAKAIDEGDGPESVEPTFKLGSIRCAFCRFSYLCHPDVDAKQAYFKTLRKKWED